MLLFTSLVITILAAVMASLTSYITKASFPCKYFLSQV